MKNYIFAIILAIFAIPAMGQSISIFDIDTTNFPTMKAKFVAIDISKNQVSDNISELSIRENSLSLNYNINCQPQKKPIDISTFILLDNSNKGNWDFSTLYKKLDRYAANYFSSLLNNQDELALATFNTEYDLKQPFSNNYSLSTFLDNLEFKNNYDFSVAFQNTSPNTFKLMETAKNRKMILLISNGYGPGDEQNIVAEALKQNCVIYVICVGLPASNFLKNIAQKTGGNFYDMLENENEINDACRKIFYRVKEYVPCEIEWQSMPYCDKVYAPVTLNWKTYTSMDRFIIPDIALASLSVVPEDIDFGKISSNVQKDTTIRLTAINAPIEIYNIKYLIGDSVFYFLNDNLPIKIPKNTFKDITLTFKAQDNLPKRVSIEFETDICNSRLFAKANYQKYNSNEYVQINFPQSGDSLVAGSDTLITWQSKNLQDTFKLSYSIDGGNNWLLLEEYAKNGSYLWKNIPKPKSNNCLIKLVKNTIDKDVKVNWLRPNFGKASIDELKLNSLPNNEYLINNFNLNGNGLKGIIKYNSIDSLEWAASDYMANNFIGTWNLAYRVASNNKGGYFIAENNYSYTYEGFNSFGLSDINIYDLSSIGRLEKRIRFGGSNNDYTNSFKQTSDSGYILLFDTESNDGTLDTNRGKRDIWVFKLNKDGRLSWKKSFGGSGSEFGKNLFETKDGGFVILANTESIEIDTNIKQRAGWLLKLDNNGNKVWESIFSNYNFDWGNFTQLENSDLLTCSLDLVNSTSGNQLFNIKKFNSKGIELWNKSISNSNYIYCIDIITTKNNEIIMAGSSISENGYFAGTKNKGMTDAFIFKLDTAGNLIWKINLGSSEDDKAFSVIQRTDGSYIVSGTNKVNDNDFSTFDKFTNSWLLYLSDYESEMTISENKFSIIAPAPSGNDIDMKQCKLGKSRDSLVVEFLINNTNYNLRIDSIYFTGADWNNFNVISNFPQFVVGKKSTQEVGIRFIPNRVGLHSAIVNIITQNDTLKYSIIGEGLPIAKATISLDSAKSFSKKEVKIPIKLKSISDLLINGIKYISTELVFNRTMLFPKNITKRYSEGDSMVLVLDSLPLVANSNNELFILRFTATLGNAEFTNMTLRNVKAIGDTADFDIINGNFKLLDVCKEGGERFLVGNKSKTMLLSIAPNPATESVEIEYSNADEGEAEIIISNLLGQTILTQKLEKTQTGIAKLDLSQLPTGQYSILFKTETVLENRIIQVIK